MAQMTPKQEKSVRSELTNKIRNLRRRIGRLEKRRDEEAAQPDFGMGGVSDGAVQYIDGEIASLNRQLEALIARRQQLPR